MSIFNKKSEPEPSRPAADVVPPAVGASAGKVYGIAEAIQLMRTLPVDQNPDLVVRVVRATLASLNVHLPDIIEDANRKQKTISERIAAVHVQVADLEKQLDTHRKEIAGLEAEMKETTGVKERLQMAEKAGAMPPPFTHEKHPTPAPLAAFTKPGSAKPHENGTDEPTTSKS
jgi:hypothetical protein